MLIVSDCSGLPPLPSLCQLSVMGGKMRSQGQRDCAKPGCGKAGLCVCSQCQVEWYCSAQCQTDHWPQHWRDCPPPLPPLQWPDITKPSVQADQSQSKEEESVGAETSEVVVYPEVISSSWLKPQVIRRKLTELLLVESVISPAEFCIKLTEQVTPQLTSQQSPGF